jgi:hypothetical protein
VLDLYNLVLTAAFVIHTTTLPTLHPPRSAPRIPSCRLPVVLLQELRELESKHLKAVQALRVAAGRENDLKAREAQLVRREAAALHPANGAGVEAESEARRAELESAAALIEAQKEVSEGPALCKIL